jgi:hypothetical protein
MIKETVSGTYETSAPFPIVVQNGFTPEFTGTTIEDGPAGFGYLVDAQTTAKGLNISLPATQRFGGVFDDLIFAYLRDTIPSDTTIVGTADIEVEIGVTLLSGETGTRLKAPTGSFNGFITYNTAETLSRGGAEQMMMYITGMQDARNDGWRRIQAVHDDTVNAFIDIAGHYSSGVVGQIFEPMVAEAASSPTIRIGIGGRTQKCLDDPTFSALWQFCGLSDANGQWHGGFGLTVNDLGGPNWTGKEKVEYAMTMIGCGAAGLGADPSGQGFEELPDRINPMHFAGRNLTALAVHRLTTGDPLVLSNNTVISFASTGTGGRTPDDEQGGTDLITAVNLGVHADTVTIGWRHKNDPISVALTNVGAVGSTEKVACDAIFEDALGNAIVHGWGHLEPPHSGPALDRGTSAFTAHMLTPTAGLRQYQKFPAL